MFNQSTFKIINSLLVLLLIAYALTSSILAEPVTTSVTVGNQSPTFAIDTFEDPESSLANRTNEGDDVTFRATATDSNSEDYYLIICSTNSATANNNAEPDCGSTEYCTSTLTASSTQANCSYTTQSSDPESNDWFSFVCDANSGSASCSSANQGSGATGSPFVVNHPPTIDNIVSPGPAQPGDTITFSTGAGTSDPDSLGGQQNIKILVCKTAGVTNGECDGGISDTWCESSYVASQPSCDVLISIPFPDGIYDAFVYVIDESNLESDSVDNGSNQQFTIQNVGPEISSITINSGSDIILTEDSVTNITLKATITDNNACTDLDSIEASFYRSGIGYPSCDSPGENNNNYCYSNISCTEVGSGDTCSGDTDASVDYECVVAIQYHADPTDVSTEFPTENWLTTFVATDDNSVLDTLEISTGIEILSIVGYTVTSSISYGSLDVGQSNDPLDKVTIVTATGNVGLDQELSGSDMTDGGSNIIEVENQRYSLSNATAYSSGSQLTDLQIEVELNVPKTTITLSPETENTWWGIEIPLTTLPGIYTGTNTIIAVKSEVLDW